jgi:hypothetical protein
LACNKLAKWIAAVYLIVTSTNAHAYDDRYYVAMFDLFEAEISPRILRMLPPNERNVIEGVELNLWMNPSVPSALVTRANPPQIIISLGFMDGLFQYIDCFMLEGNIPDISPRFCEQYFLYYVEEVIEPNSLHPDSAAKVFFRSDEQLIDRWYGNPQNEELRNLMMLSSLIFAFTHEYGHHVSGFYAENDSLAQKRQTEASADLWAAQTLDGIRERPILGAALTFGYIARLEAYRTELANSSANDPNFNQLDSPHPLPRDRMSWSFERYCSQRVLSVDSTMTEPCEMIADMIEGY